MRLKFESEAASTTGIIHRDGSGDADAIEM